MRLQPRDGPTLMCGIAGIVQHDGRPVQEGLVRQMGHVLRHRGPDDDGIYIERDVGLAFRRLAIIDLTRAGHQPMSNEDGSVWLVFNGEIYNYRELAPELYERGHIFRSRCDAEVIVHAYEEYGDACVNRFNGMFAIAIWDRNRQQLWLARDRLGIKPLYYFDDGQRFGFASEIKALRECPGVGKQANGAAIAQYLETGYSIDDQSWFAGVRKLMPGHCATVSADASPRVWSYWDPIDHYRAASLEPQRDPSEQIHDLLSDSVRLRMRSDVPIGAHLSGGLDSSSVVALMSRHSEAPVYTFSGAFREGKEYDERQFIHAVVDRFQTRHYEVEPYAKQFPELLPRLVWHMDEPTAGAGLFPQFLVCALTAGQGVKVVNGGQGGDELFAGYPKYLRMYARIAAPWQVAGRLPLLTRQAWSLRRLGVVAGRLYLRARAQNMLHPSLAVATRRSRTVAPMALSDPLLNELYVDLRYYLPALLQVEDRTSMAVSIESRIPFLDYRLVELAARIPPRVKLGDGELKHQLRRAMRDELPRSVLDRRDKRGFPTPISHWFRGELADWIAGLVRSPDLNERRVFQKEYVETVLRAHQSHLVDTSHELWRIANVALWFKEFDATPAW